MLTDAACRALKTKHDTPKYGLLYHASVVGAAQAKNKGKMSRVLAAKAVLTVCTRYQVLFLLMMASGACGCAC